MSSRVEIPQFVEIGEHMSAELFTQNEQSIRELLEGLESFTEIGAYLDLLAKQGYSIRNKITITHPTEARSSVEMSAHWIIEDPDLEDSLEVGRQRLLASLGKIQDKQK
jgi:hypothetical protein